MKVIFRITCLGLVSAFLFGCSNGSQHNDLREYIAETKSKPAGRIEGVPVFKPYDAFIYSAASMRSPFDKPLDVQRRVFAKSQKDIQPDQDRTKEYLEGFDFNSLTMVGTLKQRGTLWVLVRDNSGGIHRVTQGNFLGKNHGKIISASETKVDVIEIVSDGLDGWLERPRVLALSEKE